MTLATDAALTSTESTTSPRLPHTAARPEGRSDEDLLRAVRGGDSRAFGDLWRRYAASVRSLALTLTRGSASAADDLVSEAFARTLSAIRAGRGPSDSFRAYISIVIRHLNSEDFRRHSRAEPIGTSAEVEPYAEPVRHPAHDNGSEDARLALRALGALEADDYDILWRALVVEQPTDQIGEALGIGQHTVRVRVTRARERLRQTFIAQHLSQGDTGECSQSRAQMAGVVRDAVGAPRRKRVEAHVERCASCAEAMAEAREVNQLVESGRAHR